jgi:hypothetical protein
MAFDERSNRLIGCAIRTLGVLGGEKQTGRRTSGCYGRSYLAHLT